MRVKKNYKNILYVHIDSLEYEFKVQEDLREFIGGTPVSYKLMNDYLDQKPVIISTGPLAGYFPYVSKANLLYLSGTTLVEKYGGGTIAANLNMSSIDAIVILGTTDKNIHISIYENEITFLEEKFEEFSTRIADLVIKKDSAESQNYFTFGNISEFPIPINGNISISVESTVSYDLKDFFDYEKAYKTAIDMYEKLKVEPANNPSCVGCPMGCEKSSEGEDGENVAVLPRCLIACAYAEDIYKKIPFVYSCLTSVGYEYKHDDLEEISDKFGNIKKILNQNIAKIEYT